MMNTRPSSLQVTVTTDTITVIASQAVSDAEWDAAMHSLGIADVPVHLTNYIEANGGMAFTFEREDSGERTDSLHQLFADDHVFGLPRVVPVDPARESA